MEDFSNTESRSLFIVMPTRDSKLEKTKKTTMGIDHFHPPKPKIMTARSTAATDPLSVSMRSRCARAATAIDSEIPRENCRIGACVEGNKNTASTSALENGTVRLSSAFDEIASHIVARTAADADMTTRYIAESPWPGHNITAPTVTDAAVAMNIAIDPSTDFRSPVSV